MGSPVEGWEELRVQEHTELSHLVGLGAWAPSLAPERAVPSGAERGVCWGKGQLPFRPVDFYACPFEAAF